jgi:hypothetical protein
MVLESMSDGAIISTVFDSLTCLLSKSYFSVDSSTGLFFLFVIGKACFIWRDFTIYYAFYVVEGLFKLETLDCY